MTKLLTRIRNRYRRTLSRLGARRMVDLWPKSPIVSFTFDDFPKSALSEGGAILERYGARGTYYVSMGLMGSELPAGTGFVLEDLKQAVASGHELGCHTFAHCHSWTTRPQRFEESVIENRRSLKELAPEASFETLSYPISDPRPGTKRRVAAHFCCCRGTGDSFNRGQVDANNLQARFLEKEKGNPEGVKHLIEANRRSSGWLILATHDVTKSPTQFGCTPAFFEAIVQCALESGATILPVAKAWKEIEKSPSK